MLRLVVPFLTIALITPTATAQVPGSPAEYLARMDLDGDGHVSLAEYRDYMSRGFRHMDRDGNGILEGDEHAVPGSAPVRLSTLMDNLERAFRRQDRNGDGFLDARELAAPPR